MTEYILRDQAIIAVTGAKLPDVSASGLPIANGKRSVTDCVRRLKEIPAADVVPWETLMRYANYFCAAVSMPEFVREAKMFYDSTKASMDGGNIE